MDTKKTKKILVVNGPNLNLLGLREPGIYGSTTLEDGMKALEACFPKVAFAFFQSNIEGELVDVIQHFGFSSDGIVLNAGAYTHTSVAIHDAIKAIRTPVVEVHLSNIYQRETFRHTSLITSACVGIIGGFGMDSYRLAVDYLLNRKQEAEKE